MSDKPTKTVTLRAVLEITVSEEQWPAFLHHSQFPYTDWLAHQLAYKIDWTDHIGDEFWIWQLFNPPGDYNEPAENPMTEEDNRLIYQYIEGGIDIQRLRLVPYDNSDR